MLVQNSTSVVRLADLSLPRRQLVQLMQRVNHGYVRSLPVRRGEPVLDPPPVVVREHKFAANENGPRAEMGLADFTLKGQHLDLFRLLDEVGDGVVSNLTIKHGLPFQAEVGGP
jgi:hypothetical protein